MRKCLYQFCHLPSLYSLFLESLSVKSPCESNKKKEHQIKKKKQGGKRDWESNLEIDLRKQEEENLCFSGTNQKPERQRPFGTGLVRHCPQGLFPLFFTFLRALFFRLFRLPPPHYLPLGLRGCKYMKYPRIYSINCPGRLLNFWTSIVGAYSRLGAY